MPGTATNYRKTTVARGIGQLWIGLAIPAANARLVLHTDGTPESVANPNAMHLGMTKAGAKCSYSVVSEKREADEYKTPYYTQVFLGEAMIEAELLQVFEPDALVKLTPSAKKITGVSGVEGVTFGGSSVAPSTCAALIFPSAADPTKFCVWMLYDCQNEGEMNLTVNSKEDAAIPLKLVASAVPSRTEGDQVGALWRQV